jgi:hypothetical protein
MLALLASAALAPIAYNLPLAKPVSYDVSVGFNGYIPVLGGLEDADVEVKLLLEVRGLAPDSEGNPQAQSELKDLKILFSGAAFPFGVEDVEEFFPKNTISLTPQGRVLKTDAPDVQLPVRLPGLDVKRIPDITFLPVEFPAEEIAVGKEWRYKKPFGDSDVAYVVTPSEITDELIRLDIRLEQTYRTHEDENRNATTNEREFFWKIDTHVTGAGQAVFDRKLGLVRSMKIEADAVSDATPNRGEPVKRQLKTTLKVDLKR